MRHCLWIIGAVACGPQGFEGTLPAGAWELSSSDDDPWWHEGGTSAPCESWRVEEPDFVEVDTTYCPWFTVHADLPEGIGPEATLQGVLVHDDLWAEEPAVGVAAIAVDGQEVWRVEKQIPGEVGVHPFEVELVERAEPVRISLHVTNHGKNSWRFGGLRVMLAP